MPPLAPYQRHLYSLALNVGLALEIGHAQAIEQLNTSQPDDAQVLSHLTRYHARHSQAFSDLEPPWTIAPGPKNMSPLHFASDRAFAKFMKRGEYDPIPGHSRKAQAFMNNEPLEGLQEWLDEHSTKRIEDLVPLIYTWNFDFKTGELMMEVMHPITSWAYTESAKTDFREQIPPLSELIELMTPDPVEDANEGEDGFHFPFEIASQERDDRNVSGR